MYRRASVCKREHGMRKGKKSQIFLKKVLSLSHSSLSLLFHAHLFIFSKESNSKLAFSRKNAFMPETPHCPPLSAQIQRTILQKSEAPRIL